MGFYFDKVADAICDAVDYAFNKDAIDREIIRAQNYSSRHPDKPPKKLSAQAEGRINETITNHLANEMVNKYNASNASEADGRVVGRWDSYGRSSRGTNANQLSQAANKAAEKVGGTLLISEDKGAPIGVSGLGKKSDYDFCIPSTVYTIKKGDD